MFENLAMRWARQVLRDTRNPAISILFMLTGLVFILLPVLGIVSSQILLLTSLLPLLIGFHLFERCGLLLLMDEAGHATGREKTRLTPRQNQSRDPSRLLD